MEQTVNIDRRTVEIRRLNDELRRHGRGGKVVMTNGIAAMGVDDVRAVFAAIGAFEAFTPDNDPFGEHDCAILCVGVHRVIWKIDYFDRAQRYGSPDPADPEVTFRLLTVMLAEEY